MPFTLSLLACWMFGVSSAAKEHFLTSTFGNGERCEHRGTLTIRGHRVRFDLTAIPPSATVHRAILRVPGNEHRTGETVDVFPAGSPGFRSLELRGPLFDSFDATAAVKLWIENPDSNRGFNVARNGGVDFRGAVLEVSYSGKTADPIPAVTDLEALHQSGQTFLSWKEIEDVIAEDHPTFERFEKAVLEARGRRHLVYRIYCHDRPITVETLGRARMVREISEALSCWNLKALRNTEHPNQGTPTKRSPLRPGYNLARGDIVQRYRITDGGDPIPRGRGLAVITVTVPGKRYYAVTASIDGREAVAALGDGATLRPPVDERTADFPAIVYQRSRRPDARQRRAPVIDVYNSWIEPPYHNVPTVSETFIVRWRDLPTSDAQNRLPLFVTFGTYGSTATELASPGWHGARRHVKGAFTLGLAEGGLWQGFHECIGTLRGYEQGAVHNYPQRRVLAATAWAISRRDFFVDPERVSTWGQLGSWALRHGDVFAVVLSNGYGNPVIGKIPQQHGWQWGPYPTGSKNWLGVDQWEYMNVARWIRENPTVELPYWICAPAYGAYPSHTIGDFGFMPWPEMIHAMVSTKRAFAANWSTNGPGPTRPLHDLVPRIRLHQSLPAFTNCSLDHSPGDGDHADAQKGGGINLYPRWDPETITDERDRWEMTVYLSKECPEDHATLDLTPRRCQDFKPRPGERFRWTRVSPGQNGPLQSGASRADRWGLVTLRDLEISREEQRIIIVRVQDTSTGMLPGGRQTSAASPDWAQVAAAVRALRPSGEIGETAVLDALEARARDVLLSLEHPSNRRAWEGAVPRLRRKLAESLGLSRLPKPRPGNPRSAGVIDRGDYVIEKLIYESFPRTEVPAHLYRPARVEGRLPAILFVPGHWWADSKARPDFQSFCINMARMGFLVLSYDPIGQGERGISWRDHRRTATLLIGVAQQAIVDFESLCALEYLLSRPEVDSKRIGITGASGGGYNSWILAAIDPRIAVSVPVVGTSEFYEQLHVCRPLDWYNAKEHCHFVPGLLRYANNHELAAMIAPRPVMVIAAHNDQSFPIPGIRQVVDYARKLYASLGKPEQFGYFEDATAGHGYQKRKREAAYGWFLRWLRNEGDGSPVPEPPTETTSWNAEELRCFPPGRNRPAGPGILARVKTIRSTLPPPAAPSEGRKLEREVIEALGIALPSARRIAGTTLERGDSRRAGGLNAERICWRQEDGVEIPAVLMSPPGTWRGALLAACDDGKEALLDHPAVRAALESSHAVLLADPRGLGELAITKGGWAFAVSLLLGENFVGRQALDLIAGWRRLRALPELKGKPIGLLGSGPFSSLAALYAAVLESRISWLVAERGFVTFHSFVDRVRSWSESHTLAAPGEERTVKIDREIPHALFVFDVLRKFDLLDLFASLAPRPVLIAHAIDGDWEALSEEEWGNVFSRSLPVQYTTDPVTAAKMRAFLAESLERGREPLKAAGENGR